MLTNHHIRTALDKLAFKHGQVRKAIDKVGYPTCRRQDHSFESFVKILISQQLSTKSAAAIQKRVTGIIGDMNAEALLNTEPKALRAAGLSFRKIEYLKALATAVITDKLSIDLLPTLSDQEAIEKIINIRGFGLWSAQMYLIFSLRRQDIWPSGDLAVRIGLGKIMGWPLRPSESLVASTGVDFLPFRSSMALLCWHFYNEEMQL